MYQRLRQIHTLEKTLRDAFETGANDQGVVFIQNDKKNGISPCAPNKIAASDVITVRPNSYYLPTGFDTRVGKPSYLAYNRIEEKLNEADWPLRTLTTTNISVVMSILDEIEQTITKPNDVGFSWEAMRGLLKYYCEANKSDEVLVLLDDDRKINRSVSGDKSGLSILGTSLRPTLQKVNRKVPALVLLKQAGSKKLEWAADAPFWWPILVSPTDGVPCVYSNSTAATP